MDQNQQNKTLEILLEGVKSKLDFQLNVDNGLDAKSSTLLGLTGTVVVFYLGTENSYSWIPLVIFGLSGAFLLCSLRKNNYNTGMIDVYDETKEYISFPPDKLLPQLLSDYQKAFDDNSIILKKKNKDYTLGLTFFITAIIFIIIFSFI